MLNMTVTERDPRPDCEAATAGPAASRRKVDEQRMSVVVVRDAETLASYVRDWDGLAASAIEPNIFYESWMMMPALRLLAGGESVTVALVFARDMLNPSGAPILCGFFPLEAPRAYRGFPARARRLWKHLHCYLCTPLIRAEGARATLSAFFEWLASGSKEAPLMEFTSIAGEGPFRRLLVDYLAERARLHFVSDSRTRPMFRLAPGATCYVNTALSGKHKSELKRKEKRLAELGRIEYKSLEAGDDPTAWIDDFLQLEASGWKGRSGSAFNCDEAQAKFFASSAQSAFREGRLRMFALRLDGRAIAQQVYMTAGSGAFAFKVAFDEAYARFSPGMLLEVKRIDHLQSNREIEWLDSCAAPGNYLSNLWPYRRTIETVLVGAGMGKGDFIISLLPLLRWLKRSTPFRRPAAR
ncbi:MAG TPA: GNAT family N-acetyltransferase [Blastocatellia bacterium]|nr:GNAT family N-acetyltransferase [Blastocatellia bacterium]